MSCPMFNSLAVSASSLFVPTLILTGFVLTLPTLYFVNFYLRCKRHREASPWTPSGKIVVITGASSGIGESLAYEFARQGATLILCARRTEKLANVAKVCKEKCGAENVIIHKVDVTRESDVVRLVEAVDASYEKIDCLVLNAGVSMGQTFDSLEDFDVIKKLMEVNYYGSTMLTFHALPLLKKAEKSRIVVVSSVAGIIPSVPLRTGYAASKFALRGFYESLQSELLDKNVFVTIAYPDIVRTDIGKNRIGSNPKDMDYTDGMSPDDCAKMIVDGTVKGHKEILFTHLARLGKLMDGPFPELLSFLAYKRSKKLLYNEKKIE